MSFATVAELESFLGVPLEDVSRATQCLKVATAEIRAYKERHLERVDDDTAVLDGNGSTILLLPEFPVIDVTSVTADGDPVDDYEWSENGTLINRDGWPNALRAVEVTYTHGYQEDDPSFELVKSICLQRAGRLWVNPEQTMQNRIEGAGSMAFGSSAAEITGLTTTERRALDRV